jgi:predicted kinase
MKLNFKEYVSFKDYEMINEKLIIYNGGKKYGQIVFLAGGAGSGKGFARQKFISAESFKVRDVDELKLAFQQLSALDKFTTKQFMDKYGNNLREKDRALIQSEMIDQRITINKLNMKNPTHVYLLHMMVKASGAKEKTLDSMLVGARAGKLPNILFDITFKDLEEFNRVMPELIRVGYEPQNVHLTWVLTNYKIAIQNNKMRPRTVPEDILLSTHAGAAQTVFKLVKDGTPSEINGRVDVILNNPENTIVFKDKDGKPIRGASGFTVKDFTYLNLKDPGKKAKTEIEVKKQLLMWIRDNTPPDALDTSELDKL